MPSLRALHDAGHDIVLVITQPDRPGHRMKVTPPPVKVAAKELGLPVLQPEKIRDPSVISRLRELKPDLIVVVAYGQIIPRDVLTIPAKGVVNVHASLLPRHRQATVAPRLRKQDGELELDMDANEIDRRVRALQPWPGTTLPTRRGRVKVLSGHVEGARYVPDVVQLPGKKPAPAKQVLGDA